MGLERPVERRHERIDDTGLDEPAGPQHAAVAMAARFSAVARIVAAGRQTIVEPEIHASQAGGISSPGVAVGVGCGVECVADVVGAAVAASGLGSPGRSNAQTKSPVNTAIVARNSRRRSRVPDPLVIHPG